MKMLGYGSSHHCCLCIKCKLFVGEKETSKIMIEGIDVKELTFQDIDCYKENSLEVRHFMELARKGILEEIEKMINRYWNNPMPPDNKFEGILKEKE